MVVGRVKAEPCKTFPEAPPNSTDVDQSITQVKSNDPALTELNLNNMQVGRGRRLNSVDDCYYLCRRRHVMACMHLFSCTKAG